MPAYTCDLCGIGFHRAGSLARHMRIHTDERPYQCPVCECSYRNRLSLDRHMRTHTRVISFQCDRCESSFRNRTFLNRHMRFFHRTSGIYGAQATTHAQHTESLHGIANTVATVNSSLGTAIVTIVRSTTPLTTPLTTPRTTPLVTTTVSQASGTVTVTHLDLERDYGNECPICFDSLNDGETITTPCCSAKYHIACLRKLDQLNSTGFFCPNCRGELTRDWLSKTPER